MSTNPLGLTLSVGGTEEDNYYRLLIDGLSGEFHAWLEQFLSLKDMDFFGSSPLGQEDRFRSRGPNVRSGEGTESPWVGMASPNFTAWQPPRLKINSFWVPTGASRWSFGLFLMDGKHLECFLRELDRTDSQDEQDGWAVLKFVPKDDYVYENTQHFAGKVFALSSVQLASINRGWRTNKLYILPLVDERYFWQYKSTGNLDLTNNSTWSELYDDLAAALGVSIYVDEISSSYGFPDPIELSRKYDNPAVMLDAVAASVGQRIIYHPRYSGALVAMNADGAAVVNNQNLTRDRSEYEQVTDPVGYWNNYTEFFNELTDQPDGIGVQGDYYPQSHNRIHAGKWGWAETEKPGDVYRKSQPLPAEVEVVFPRYENKEPVADGAPHAVTVTALEAEYPGFDLDDDDIHKDRKPILIKNTKKIIRTTAAADFTDGSALPDNDEEVEYLALRIAKDFYKWSWKRKDVTFPGFWPWFPTGFDDWVWHHFAVRSDGETLRQPPGLEMGDMGEAMLKTASSARSIVSYTQVRGQPENFGVTCQLQQLISTETSTSASDDCQRVLSGPVDDLPIEADVENIQYLVGIDEDGCLKRATVSDCIEDTSTSGPTTTVYNMKVYGELTTDAFYANGDGIEVTGDITVTGEVDGRDISVDGAKLDSIDSLADATTLATVSEAGAVMELDTSTDQMQFVIDEDDMVSNLATKVPTQQSVKAYADLMLPLAGGTMSGNIAMAGAQTVDGRDVSADGSTLDTHVAASAPHAGHAATSHTHVEADITDLGSYVLNSEVDADIKTLELPSNTTISAFGASLVDDADAPAARTTLGVDAAGTDNSAPVTLSGAGTYLSLVGQEIAVDLITESDISDLGSYIEDITGEPFSDLSDATITSIASNEVLKWSGSAWINNTLAEAGISATGHTHTESDITDLGSYSVVGHTHTLTDITDSGALAALATVDTAQIDVGAVTYARIQNMAAVSKLLGRGSAAGTGDVEEIDLGTNLSMSGTTLNATPGAGASQLSDLSDVNTSTPTNRNVLVADGVDWESRSLALADITDDGNLAALDTVDTAQIDNGAVTLAKMADMATDSFIGRTTALAGVPEVLDKADALAILNVEDGADVTDTANVTAAGALMDSEVDADIKTLVLPASTTISTFGRTLIDDASVSAARSTLGVDVAGTDNSTNVTLAGSLDYLTIVGQVITRGAIDLTADVTGLLPTTNVANLSGANTGDEPSASTTVPGIVELATVTEVNTGTDNTRAITPLGLAGWTGGGGDDLGNHTATKNIQLGSWWLSGDGGNEGIKVDASGNIEVSGRIAQTELGNSVFVGENAGDSDDLTGNENVGLGQDALTSNTTGTSNVACGAYALATSISAVSGTGVGSLALRYSTGHRNTGIGYIALGQMTTGTGNTGCGVGAGDRISGGAANQTSSNSVYLGYNAYAGTNGNTNEIVLGYSAIGNGSNTITLGNDSNKEMHVRGRLSLATSASSANVYIGLLAGDGAEAAGSSNVGIGYKALTDNAGSCDYNVAVGSSALENSTSGDYNVAIGHDAMSDSISGIRNVCIGRDCLAQNSTGSYNVAIGGFAGQATSTSSGNNSVFVGYLAKPSADDSTNEIVIGYSLTGAGSNTMSLGNANITKTLMNGDVLLGGVGTSPTGTGTEPGLFLADTAGTRLPPAGYAGLFADDEFGSNVELYAVDEGGNATKISPHDEEGNWIFYSKHVPTGRVKQINIEKLVRAFEKLTGESFTQEWFE